ncbi:MAG: Fic family protein [Ramlibacter sp.]
MSAKTPAQGSPAYVWQQPAWPHFSFDADAVGPALLEARRLQGDVNGRARAIGLSPAGDVVQELMAQEVLATAAIEGEKLDPASVRSSVMRQLGLGGAGTRDRHVDGLVEVINDASAAFTQPLDADRLCRWQSALFPGGTSGLQRIAVGRWRDHEDPMQIVSGVLGRQTIHYEAPPSAKVAFEMDQFLHWFADTTPVADQEPALDGIARAAIAHLWFESIHPFEDGNGRIGRAIVDMALAQDQGGPLRLFSLSRQLLASRSGYYDALNAAQRGNGDATDWVQWFAQQIAAACRRSGDMMDAAIQKSRFWADHAAHDIGARQRKVLQRLLDDGDGGFLGGLSADKYMKMTGVSKATATRDLQALVAAGLLWTTGQGKATRYYVNVPGWTHGVDVQQRQARAARS